MPIWTIERNRETRSIEAKKKGRKKPIKGHEGKLKVYKIKNKYALIFSGRRHLYEGFDITDVIFPVRITYDLGIKNILITNAAGGINTSFNPGDIMLITGFINLMQPTERGIIDGITLPSVNIKSPLSYQLSATSYKLKRGIYAGMLGPTYETYAEINLLQKLNADAVGMSTIPELISAKSLGLNHAGISVISNVWNKKHKPSHEEVIKSVDKANEKLSLLALRLIEALT